MQDAIISISGSNVFQLVFINSHTQVSCEWYLKVGKLKILTLVLPTMGVQEVEWKKQSCTDNMNSARERT